MFKFLSSLFAAITLFFSKVVIGTTPVPLPPTPNPHPIVSVSTTINYSDKKIPTITPTPSLSLIPTKILPSQIITTPIFRPIVTNTPIPTPTEKPDTTAPILDFLTGPGDGQTVSFTNFCFPMKYHDDRNGPISVQYEFDSNMSDWNTNYAPCYSGVSNGSHTFSVMARDQAGNQSSKTTRTFTVNSESNKVPTPSPTSVSP